MHELPRRSYTRDWRFVLLTAVLFAVLFVVVLFRVVEPWAVRMLQGPA